MAPDPQGGLFSEALNLYFRCEEQHHTHVRLLRPYLPDGTPITTSLEEQHLKEAAEARAETAEARAEEEALRRQQAETELEKLRAQIAQSQRS